MNILHIGWGHAPEHLSNGAVAYTHELCEQLALKGHRNALLAASPLHIEGEQQFAVCRRVYRDVDVYAVTNRHSPSEDLLHPMHEVGNRESEKVFREVIDEFEPDVIHFHSMTGFCASLMHEARELGIPSVVSMHDHWLICPKSDLIHKSGEVCTEQGNGARCAECLGDEATCEAAQAYADRYSMMMLWLREADMVIAESKQMADPLVSHGVKETRVAQIRPAAKTAEALWAWKHRREHNSGGPLVFGYIGEISRSKAPHLLIEAASMLEDIRDRFRVSIQGAIVDPQYAQEIEQRILKLQYQLPGVGLGGDYEQSSLHRILSEMDVCVVPTLRPENPPRTAMEALGARVPVIASMVGGMPEIVEHGVNGLLFERGNAESLAMQMRFILEHATMPRHLRVRIKAPRPMAVHAGEISAIYERLAILASMRRGPEEHELLRQAA